MQWNKHIHFRCHFEGSKCLPSHPTEGAFGDVYLTLQISALSQNRTRYHALKGNHASCEPLRPAHVVRFRKTKCKANLYVVASPITIINEVALCQKLQKSLLTPMEWQNFSDNQTYLIIIFFQKVPTYENLLTRKTCLKSYLKIHRHCI